MASNQQYNPYNQQPPPGSGNLMPPHPDGNSYASRSAQAYVNSTGSGVPPHHAVDQYQQSQPRTQSYQQPQYYTPAPPVTQQSIPESSHNSQYGRMPSPYHNPNPVQQDAKTVQSQQNLLETSIHRMQEASHIMRGAMDADDLATTLDRAAAMLGELGDPKHHHHHHHHHGHGHHNQGHSHSSTSTAVMSPKHYYEIHMLAMEELPNIEEYFLSLSSGPSPQYSMKDLYEITQYTSRAVPRLYLQICAGSALIRSGEEDVTNVLNDLIQAVKCVQCPIRGLFLRDYLLKAVRDKLPDEAEVRIQQQSSEGGPGPEQFNATGGSAQPNNTLTSLMGDLTMNTNESNAFLQSGNANAPTPNAANENTVRTRSDSFENSSGKVKDSYQFVLANFIEMNKLWVRIQHLPGDPKNKETKRRRERERNELRMMVGTNLVRLSELEGVTSSIYGTVILPRILDQIVACRDPLAQAYLMDCIIQVFPDEFHIQTLEVVLGVCPKLREKVNIRTILQSVMDRLSNYYADELLLNDEEDTEGVKTSVMLDSFEMFDECIRAVLGGRGSKINAKEVIRLESSLLDFSLKCYPGRMDHVNRCLGVCAACLRGEGTSNGVIGNESVNPTPIPIDEVAVKELETLLSLPLETMGLNILDLDQYAELLQFLPLDHRKRVALELLNVLYQSGEQMTELSEIEQLFAIVSPLIWTDDKAANEKNSCQERDSISKLIHLLQNDDTDIQFEILNFVKKYLFSSGGGIQACSYTVSPLFYSSMKLLRRVKNLEFPSRFDTKQEDEEVVNEPDIDEEVVEDSEVGTDDVVDEDVEKEEVLDIDEKKEEIPDSPDSENDAGDLTDGDGEVDENLDTAELDNDEQKEEQLSDTSDLAGSDEKEETNSIGIKSDENVDTDADRNIQSDNLELAQDVVDSNVEVTNDEAGKDVNDESDLDVDEVNDEKVEATEDANEVKGHSDSGDSNALNGTIGHHIESRTKEQESEPLQNEEVMAEEGKNDDNIALESPSSDEVVSNKDSPQNVVELFPFDDNPSLQNSFTKATNCRKVFLFVQKLLSFVEMTSAELCFNLRLQAAAAADNCAVVSTEYGNASDFATIAYEFMSEAFLTYEAEISESSAQKVAMMKIIGVLLACNSFQRSDYETLITKATQNSARLLRKTDQCSMVLLCSHLFFKEENVYQNPQRVLECLQRALKLADVCTTANPANLSLFIDIFDKYVYFFEKDNPFITDKFISGLIALINEHINSISIGVPNHVIGEAKAHYMQIVKYIECKKSDDVLGEKFSMIICNVPGF